jgi:hypothetical protein
MIYLEGNQKDQEIVTSSSAHKVLTLYPITLGKDYEYQFKEEEGMMEPQWEIFYGKLPNGIKLEQSGKLHGKLTGKQEEYKGKKYNFLVKAFEKSDKSKVSFFDAHLEVNTDSTGDTTPKVFNIKDDIRMIIGYEQGAASSLDRKQSLFVDFYFNFPILVDYRHDNWLKSKLSLWGNIRLTSTPLDIESKIEDITTRAGLVSKIKEVKINQVAQAVEFQGGLEFRISRNRKKKNHSFNFILGMNATTPISVKESIEIFKISDDVKNEYKKNEITGEVYDYEGKEYVALVPPGRDKFFRQYYMGFRLKSNITQKVKKGDNDKTETVSRFPATLDLVYGWKDRGTKGFFKGFFKFELFLPLKLGNNLNVYLFGSLMFITTKTKLSDHLLLESAPDGVTYPADNILKIITPEIYRDFYRVGIGIDVVNIFD